MMWNQHCFSWNSLGCPAYFNPKGKLGVWRRPGSLILMTMKKCLFQFVSNGTNPRSGCHQGIHWTFSLGHTHSIQLWVWDWDMPCFCRTFLHVVSNHCLISNCCIELACLSDQALQWVITSCSVCIQLRYFSSHIQQCRNYESLFKTTGMGSQVSHEPRQSVNKHL